MKKHWCVFFVLLIASQTVKADDNDPNELLQVKWDALAKVPRPQELDHASKEKIIDKIVSSIFDFVLMRKLTLGKTNWSKLTPSQYETFSQLFVKRFRVS
jgi:ABC-type transporter MlaC component